MATISKTGSTQPFVAAPTTLEARPLARLKPASSGALSAAAVRGLQDLRKATEDAAPLLTNMLVAFSFRQGVPLDLVTRRDWSTGLLNRRRRSARLWINAVLGGHWNLEMTRTLRRVWLPQLAGTKHYAQLTRGVGGDYVEFLRGAITAWTLDGPEANLVPSARALHSLDCVLAAHLRAIVVPMAQVDRDDA